MSEPITADALRKAAGSLEAFYYGERHQREIDALRTAADRIEALEAELARVREALRKLAIFGVREIDACRACSTSPDGLATWVKGQPESHNPISGHPCPAELPKD